MSHVSRRQFTRTAAALAVVGPTLASVSASPEPATPAPAPDDRTWLGWVASRRLDGSATLTDPRGTRRLRWDGDAWIDSLTGYRVKFGHSVEDGVVVGHFMSDDEFDRLPGIFFGVFFGNGERKPWNPRSEPWNIEA